MEDLTHWHVFLYGIEWDDGNGEYDVSELPVNVRVALATDFDDEDAEEEAMEYALDQATDAFGSLINATRQIVAKRIEPRATHSSRVDRMASVRRVK